MFVSHGHFHNVSWTSSFARVSSVLAALVALLTLGAPSALAARSPQVQPFSLQAEYTRNSPNPSAPTWCLNEDDWHYRSWSGSFSGSFVATEQLCNPAVDYSGATYWTAGGIGLQTDLYVVGTLSNLSITSPQGVSHTAVLVGSQYLTKQHAVENHYQACFSPPYSLSTDMGGTPLPGGTWTINLAGTFSQAGYTLQATMTDVRFQQQYCPASEQALAP